MIAIYLIFIIPGGARPHANRLLALVLLESASYYLLEILTTTGSLPQTGSLLLIASALHILILPTSLLYTRAVLYNTPSLRTLVRQKGWLFFAALPAFAFKPWFAGAFIAAGLLLQWSWVFKARYDPASDHNKPGIPVWLLPAYSALISMVIIFPAAHEGSPSPIISSIGPLAFTLLCSAIILKPSLVSYSTGPSMVSSITTPAIPPVTSLAAAPPIDLAAHPLPAPRQHTQSLPKSLFDGPALKQHMQQVSDNLIRQALFKKKGLTLAALAVELSLPQHHLSYIIKEGFGQQFNEFINSFRVNYIKELFHDSDAWEKMTMEGLGSDAGFSSRSTFFSAFKKQTGLTPAEYARRIRRSNDPI